MRVSSLSDERNISLVSKYFVPVWVSRDRYQLDAFDREELLLLKRIDKSRVDKKYDGGTVCVYIARDDGDTIAALRVQKASKPDLLEAFLKKLVEDEKLQPRKSTATSNETRARTAESAKTKDGRLFIVRTRLDIKENRGTTRDILELTKEEWSAFVAKKGAKVGDSWKVSKSAAEKLLLTTYPPMAYWNAKLAKMEKCELTAKVTEAKGTTFKVRLEGHVDLIYPYKGEPTDARMTAKVFGNVRCEDGTLKVFEIASDDAKYVYHWDKQTLTRPMTFTVEAKE